MSGFRAYPHVSVSTLDELLIRSSWVLVPHPEPCGTSCCWIALTSAPAALIRDAQVCRTSCGVMSWRLAPALDRAGSDRPRWVFE